MHVWNSLIKYFKTQVFLRNNEQLKYDLPMAEFIKQFLLTLCISLMIPFIIKEGSKF